jgi:hypothetical protein
MIRMNLYCARAFVWVATLFSGSAAVAIVDSAIAVCCAELRLCGHNDAKATNAISRVWRGDRIIATGSGNTGNAAPAALGAGVAPVTS